MTATHSTCLGYPLSTPSGVDSAEAAKRLAAKKNRFCA